MTVGHLAAALASGAAAMTVLATAGCGSTRHAPPTVDLHLASARTATAYGWTPPAGRPTGPTSAATTGREPSAPADPAAGVPGCDPNYSPCVPTAVDVDCADMPGQDGPAFVAGPVRVIGIDVYHLDGVDGDGLACERLGR